MFGSEEAKHISKHQFFGVPLSSNTESALPEVNLDRITQRAGNKSLKLQLSHICNVKRKTQGDPYTLLKEKTLQAY